MQQNRPWKKNNVHEIEKTFGLENGEKKFDFIIAKLSVDAGCKFEICT